MASAPSSADGPIVSPGSSQIDPSIGPEEHVRFRSIDTTLSGMETGAPSRSW